MVEFGTTDSPLGDPRLADNRALSFVLDLHDEIQSVAEAVPPLPGSVVQLAAVISNEESTIDDVVEVVRQDPGLTAALLSGANSAASGAQSTITTVEAALVRLGMGRCLALACADSLGPHTVTELDSYGLAPGAHWQHSVASSYVAEVLVRKLGGSVGADVVTSALLHTIGRVVLNDKLDKSLFAELSRHMTVEMAEYELLGVDHADVGGLMLEMWKVPDIIVQAVRNYPRPTGRRDDPAAVVSLSSHLAYDLLPGLNEEFRDPAELTRLADALEVDLDQVREESLHRLEAVGVIALA